MARATWCSAQVYEAAVAFRDRCLIDDDSLFTPGERVWTAADLAVVAEHAGTQTEVGGSFVDKLVAQIEDLTETQRRLAAELAFAQLLPELDTGAAKKREHLGRMLDTLPVPIPLPAAIDAALAGGGVANFSSGKSHRHAYLRFLSRVFLEVKQLDRGARHKLLADPWAFQALVVRHRTSVDAMPANALLHLLFPDVFEYVISPGQRALLIASFADAPGVQDADGDDRKIARIRELASPGGDRDLNFYEDPFHRVWKDAPPARWAETAGWARRLFEAPDFDETERDYKLRVADRVGAARDALLGGGTDWAPLLRTAFTARENNLTSWRVHDPFLGWVEAHPDDAAVLLRGLWAPGDLTGLDGFLGALPFEAVRGTGTRVSVASFLLLASDATRLPFFKPSVFGDLRGLVGETRSTGVSIDPDGLYRPNALAARMGVDGARVRAFLREAFPRGEDERGAGWHLTPDEAERVLAEFGDVQDTGGGVAIYQAWLDLLEELRLRVLADGAQLRDLLDAQGLAWWLVRREAPRSWNEEDRAAFRAFQSGDGATGPGPAAVEGSAVEDLGARDDKPAPAGTGPVTIPAPTVELVRRTNLPESWLRSSIDLLNDKRQVILYGPPGTGKTFVAQGIAEHIAAAGGSTRLVQFHPSYTYEDFFEGFRPRAAQGGQLTFELVPGALRLLAQEAREKPDVPHLLVIDEINRGNLAKIFGELYFLLEYRDRSIALQYSPTEEFSIPSNLFVVGTMNTADRSIALVDSALRRRFAFTGLIPTKDPVRGVLAAWLAARGHDPEPADLLRELNAMIDDDDLAIGPSYFMPKDESAPHLERVWEHAILPLLAERYYGTDDHDPTERFGLEVLRKQIADAADAAGTADGVAGASADGR